MPIFQRLLKRNIREDQPYNFSDHVRNIFENKNFRVLSSIRLNQKYDTNYSFENKAARSIIINNKLDQTWHELVEDDCISGIKGFDHWLVGFLVSKGKKESIGKVYRKPLENWIDNLKRFDSYCNYDNNNFPYYLKGLLVIHNTNT